MESYLHRQIHDLLVKAREPVFISDERIDGDSLGASLALADFMASRGKVVPVYVASMVPEQYRRLPRAHQCTTSLQIFDNPEIDLVIVFDCSDAEFVRSLVERIPGNPTVVNIDHHTTNSRYGHVNQVVEGAPATTAVVHQFFEENQIIPSRDAATCLLTGLCFDTTAFSNAATNERALDVASKLLLGGARVQDVIHAMFHNRSVSALRVWGAALERIEEDREQNMISTYLTRGDIDENHVSDDEIDGLSNFLNLVTDVDTLRVFRETADGHVKVSMRSLTRDVSEIAKQHGGGGHKRAAGYVIPQSKLVCGEDGCWRVEKVGETR
ncbi:MAG TPA: DHH family phosphoesterase [Patescibacteria group bacterium]|nr:DHH family phosphoesterase [Patescibacteria group bacterium]